MSIFDPNNQFRARLVQERYEFQDHIDGIYGIHDGYDVVINPPIIVNGVSCNTAYKATLELKNYIEGIENNLPIATSSVIGAIRLGSDNPSYTSSLGGSSSNIKVVRITNSLTKVSIPSVNSIGNVLKVVSNTLTSAQNIPSGTAGGDLSGSYPNPTVADLTISGEQPGDLLYYNGTNWVRFATPNFSGLVLKVNGSVLSWVTPTFFTPTGVAGGVLAGTYPNPAIPTSSIPITALTGGATQSFLSSSSSYVNQNMKYGDGIYYDGYLNAIYPSKARYIGIEEHFVDSSSIYYNSFIYNSADCASGLTITGAMGAASTAVLSTGSGGGFATTQKIRLVGRQKYVCRAMYIVSNAECTFGYFDNTSSNTFTNGLYFRITAGKVRLTAKKAGVIVQGNSINISLNKFYRFIIEVLNTGSCIGNIYDDDDNLIYTSSIASSDLPLTTSALNTGYSISKSSNANIIMMYCDYLSYHDVF